MNRPAGVRAVADVVTAAVEAVFAEVALLRDAFAALGPGPLADATVAQVRPLILDLLHRPDQVAVGMGFIPQPEILLGRPSRLEWWQTVEGRNHQLDADLNPDSLGYYDYVAAEWFEVPRRTGERHLVGPYVDVHGTERYTVTLTMPVFADRTFLGVAGADLPVDRLERLVLQQVSLDTEFVLVNSEQRVIVSTHPDHLPGSWLTVPPGAVPVDAAGWWVLP